MKLMVRIFAFAVVIAGAAAASVSSTTPKTFASHQSASASMPIPLCGPGICPPETGGGGK